MTKGVSCSSKMSRLLALTGLLVAFCEVTSAQAKRTIQIVEGQPLWISCNTTRQSYYQIYWTKNDTKSGFIYRSAELLIREIRRNDTGDYVCHVFNTETQMNVTVEVVHVDVMYPATVTGMSNGRTEIRENQTVQVACDMEGNPDPIWSIRNTDTDEEIFSSGMSGYVVTAISGRCQSTGHWACTGFNKLNHRNVSKGFDLFVECSPRPNGNQVFYKESMLHKMVAFEMNYLAYPAAYSEWNRPDGKPMRGRTINTNHSTMLHFDYIEVSDFGNYTVTVANDYGEYQGHYQLAPTGPPQKPTNFRYLDVTYDSVKLRWTSGYDMGSRQHFMILRLFNGNEYSQISEYIYDNTGTHGIDQEWEYTLYGLTENTFYNLSVLAENDRQKYTYGFSNWVSFYTPSAPETFSDGDSDDSTYMIIGISVGSFVCLIGLAFLVYMCKWRKMRTSYTKL